MTEENKEHIPIDQASRVRITTETQKNFFVEAGAGTGKTTSLVRRVNSLVKSGCPFEEILIITFTKKATGELRSRIRRELIQENSKIKHEDIDKILISTIHGFCQLTLSSYPTIVGLPYNFTTLEPDEEKGYFVKRWGAFINNLDPSDPLTQLALATHTNIGLKVNYTSGNVFDMAKAFQEKWHLFKDWNSETKKSDLTSDYSQMEAECGATIPNIQNILSENNFKELCEKLRSTKQKNDLEVWAEYARQFLADYKSNASLMENAALLSKLLNFPARTSKDDKVKKLPFLKEFLEFLDSLYEFLMEIWIFLLAGFTRKGVVERTRSGKVIYHDLLVLTLDLLNIPIDGKRIQKELSQKYPHILIDEFQDTDPIQLDIAMLIGASSTKEKPDESSLMVVGDPKQSIYGFRGANADNYEEAKNNIESETLELTQNFRTVDHIIAWVNETLGGLISTSTSSSEGKLEAVRKIPDSTVGPPVLLLESSEEAKTAKEKRTEEAKNVALSILLMLKKEWKVEDDGTWRPVQSRDICILVPSRTEIDIFTKALANRSIPFLLELGEVVYESQEVRDLIHTLHALENPDNDFAVVRALRTPLFGVGDDELLEYKKIPNDNSWNYLDPTPKRLAGKIPEKVNAAFEFLRETYTMNQELEPSQLVQHLIHSRLQLEVVKSNNLAVDQNDFEFKRIERQLEIFTNLISNYSAASLAEVLETIQVEINTKKRFNPALQDTKDPSKNAVRIMTMHSSKGLEFPVVILANLHGKPQNKGAKISETETGDMAIYFSAENLNQAYKNKKSDYDKRDLDENSRLLYVAATRARDHLLTTVVFPNEESKPKKESTAPAAIIGKAYQKSQTGEEQEEDGDEDEKREDEEKGGEEEAKRGKEEKGEEGETDATIKTPTKATIMDTKLLEKALKNSGEVIETMDLNSINNPLSATDTSAIAAIDIDEWKSNKQEILKKANRKILLSASDIKRKITKENVEKSADINEEIDEEADTETINSWMGLGAKNKGSDFGNVVHKVLQYLEFETLSTEELQKSLKKYTKQFCASEGMDSSNEEKVEKTVQNFLKSDTIKEAREADSLRKEIQLQTYSMGNLFFRGFIDLLYTNQKANQKDTQAQYNIIDFKTIGKLDDEFLDERMKSYRYQGASYVMALQEVLQAENQTPEPKISMSFLFGNEQGTKLREMTESEISETIEEIQAQLTA